LVLLSDVLLKARPGYYCFGCGGFWWFRVSLVDFGGIVHISRLVIVRDLIR